MKKLPRYEIIEALINDDLDISSISDSLKYLYDLLKKGFKGYNNYTNKEFEKEYSVRLNPYNMEKIKVTGRK